jgi:hypothetical protein
VSSGSQRLFLDEYACQSEPQTIAQAPVEIMLGTQHGELVVTPFQRG